MDNHNLELDSTHGHVFHVARETLKESDVQEIGKSDFLSIKI